MNQKITIDISFSAILKVFGTLLGLWLLWVVRDVVLLLFLTLIIVMALDPLVDKLEKQMRRGLAVGLLFVVLLAIIGLAVGLIIPPLVVQIAELGNNIPLYTDKLQEISNSLNQPTNEGITVLQQIFQSISTQLASLPRNLISTTIGIISGFVSFLTIVVLSIYLLLDETGIRKFVVSIIPHHNRTGVYNAINKIGDKLGAWLRGQLILMLVIGLAAIVWASVLGLPYPLALGLWAGLTEVIPFLGPIIGGLPLVLLALHFSVVKALIAVALLAVTQQVESNFLVPKVMQRSVGLSPIIVIIALLTGTKLFGIVGTILSVPIAATLMVIIQEWPHLFKNSPANKSGEQKSISTPTV